MGNRRLCSIHTFPDCVDIIVPGKSRLFRKDLPDTNTSFNWKDVTEIVAFKRDCWIVDLICFVIEINKTETLELNENMIGWKSLTDAIPHYLAGALAEDEWYTKVAVPAFKPCQTQIYSRPAEPKCMQPSADKDSF